MEEQNFQQQEHSTSGNVSFPTVGEAPKKGNGAKTLLMAGILILVGILGFVIFKSASKKSEVISIESISGDNLSAPATTETVAPSSTPLPSASSTPKTVSKATITVEVQNGTGITGEAAYLQNILKDMGYTKVSIGNASSQDATITTATFSKTLNTDVVDELTKKLQTLYQEVSIKTSTTQLSDVIVVTGVRKGSTIKPSATATPKASNSPSPKASPTATP